MSRVAPDTYSQGIRDSVEIAFVVRDLIEGGMPYTALQAVDILIGLLQISGEIAKPPEPPE